MARVTVEDCVEKVPSRFELVLLASERARQINSGEAARLPRDGEKATVTALREIAAGKLEVEGLRESVVRGQQKVAMEEETLPAEQTDEDAVEPDFSALVAVAEPGADTADEPFDDDLDT
jgi:DNA-directed RNA polymerase subunit omega